MELLALLVSIETANILSCTGAIRKKNVIKIRWFMQYFTKLFFSQSGKSLLNPWTKSPEIWWGYIRTCVMAFVHLFLNVNIPMSFLSVMPHFMWLYHMHEPSCCVCLEISRGGIADENCRPVCAYNPSWKNWSWRDWYGPGTKHASSWSMSILVRSFWGIAFLFWSISRQILHLRQWPVCFWKTRIWKHSKILYYNSWQWLPRPF